MEKQIVKKIISLAIIFTFAMFFLQIFSPLNTSAATKGLDWENPNKNGNPYSFKVANPLKNPAILMQVVGCTGVVDTVSKALLGLVQKKLVAAQKKLLIEALSRMCWSAKGGKEVTTAGIPNMSFPEAIKDVFHCPQETSSPKVNEEMLSQAWEAAEREASNKKREECLNGVAFTLAKNQLTAMTRYTMNWVNTGFSGNPMYVRDITTFTNSIEKNILEKEVNKFTDRRMAYPYGSDFSRSLINSYNGGGLRSGFNNMTDSLTSDMTVFLTDTDTYYPSTPEKTASERAQEANDRFSNDFLTGGWEGWLGLTQRDQNNPMGFTMLASQYIAEEQTYENKNIADELFQNNGFLSQKKCVRWARYESDGVELKEWQDGLYLTVFSDTKQGEFDQCSKYETVTPGSLVKEKVGYYINSPERQLELADTLNEALNGLFTAMIARFQDQGLSSLSSNNYVYTDAENMGQGLGADYWTTEGTNIVENTSGGYTGQFDLTRDLGNTYIHDYNSRSLGNWNAKTNTTNNREFPKLYMGLGPKNEKGEIIPNGYYVVTTAGNTKLFENGFNGWAVGDRAFWSGSEWQNWKKDVSNPIKKRGIIQVQKDYVVVAKETLGLLPSILPKLGELDYCIPGPNPNLEINYSETATAFSDAVFSLGTDMRSMELAWNGVKDGTYKAYKNMFVNAGDVTRFMGVESINNNTWATLTGFISNFPGAVKSGDDEYSEVAEGADYITNYISNGIMDFAEKYKEVLNPIYGNTPAINYSYALAHPNEQHAGMLVEKIYDEKDPYNSDKTIDNPYYLPMAQEGLNITKNITSYSEDIYNTTQKYQDDIVQAEANTAKLMQIREYVSVIIQAAQARRDAKLLAYLNENKEAACAVQEQQCLQNGGKFIPCHTAYENCTYEVMTMTKYKQIYKDCLEEENIVYYDDLEIMEGTGVEELRCNDNLDNDMDGLTDQADPDCSGMGNKQCNNGIDDDRDGKTDYPNDPGCDDVNDDNEYNVVHNKCNDDIDNDEDELIDEADPGCHLDNNINKAYLPYEDDESDPSQSGLCKQDTYISMTNIEDTEHCEIFSNTTETACENHKYNHINKSYNCKWTPS